MISNEYKEIKGDASPRKFYRDNKNKCIIVFAKKEKEKNLLIYDAINKLLSKNKINTPKLIFENYKKNIIGIEDLGNLTGLKKFKKFKVQNYLKLINIINQLQKIKSKNVETFLKTNYKIPKYTNNLLLEEANLFIKWYLPTKIKKNKKHISLVLLKILKKLVFKLQLKKKVITHRDFHISNIMISKNKLYIIDSQDVVYGNEVYDLASLIDDVRIKVSLSNREKIYKKYIFKKKVNQLKFRNDFEILSILRNLKIIGIFTRLLKRDNKNSYVKMIPYAWQMIDERRKNNKKLYELNTFLDKYFPKKVRNNK